MKRQTNGFILVVALLMLLIMSILGLTTLQMASLKERISHNSALVAQGISSSESTLLHAESTLISNEQPNIDAQTSCSSPPCSIWASSANLDFSSATDAWWELEGNQPDFDDNSYYIIEETGFVSDTLNPDDLAQGIGVGYYRVTSRSNAPDSTEIILQSIFAQRY